MLGLLPQCPWPCLPLSPDSAFCRSRSTTCRRKRCKKMKTTTEHNTESYWVMGSRSSASGIRSCMKAFMIGMCIPFTMGHSAWMPCVHGNLFPASKTIAQCNIRKASLRHHAASPCCNNPAVLHPVLLGWAPRCIPQPLQCRLTTGTTKQGA